MPGSFDLLFCRPENPMKTLFTVWYRESYLKPNGGQRVFKANFSQWRVTEEQSRWWSHEADWVWLANFEFQGPTMQSVLKLPPMEEDIQDPHPSTTYMLIREIALSRILHDTGKFNANLVRGAWHGCMISYNGNACDFTVLFFIPYFLISKSSGKK